MKRIFLILAVILILLTGCNNSTELSDTPTESIPAIVITETVTTPTTENEDPKGTTDALYQQASPLVTQTQTC